MGLSRPVLGFTETREIALDCIKEAAHLLPQYVELVHAAIARREGNTDKKVAYEIADLLQSVVASILQGSNEYGQTAASSAIVGRRRMSCSWRRSERDRPRRMIVSRDFLAIDTYLGR